MTSDCAPASVVVIEEVHLCGLRGITACRLGLSGRAATGVPGDVTCPQCVDTREYQLATGMRPTPDEIASRVADRRGDWEHELTEEVIEELRKWGWLNDE